MKQFLLSAIFALLALPAMAVETSMQLVLKLEGNAQRDITTYQCEGLEDDVVVEYINAHPIFLAILPVEGENLIFVNVISASGARYVSGQYVWWSRGNEAQLINEQEGDDAAPIACIASQDIP